MLSIVDVVEESDHLALVAAHEGEILRGAGFQFVMIPATVGFALLLHPTLRIGNEALSLGFVGFRLLAGAFHLIGVLLLRLMRVVGQQFLQSGGANTAEVEAIGSLLRTGRDLVNHVAVIVALGLGDLLLFSILHRKRMVPRWLSAWGFVGTGLTLLASLLLLFGVTGVVTPLYLGMNAPLALQSLALATWLIMRGLDTTARPPGGLDIARVADSAPRTRTSGAV